MQFQVLAFVLLSLLVITKSEHLILGDTVSRKLIHHTLAQYHAIPFMKREKNVFFSSEEQRIIRSILAYDNLYSEASATITAGGLGYTYVNLRLESERGKGLDYDIGIYT